MSLYRNFLELSIAARYLRGQGRTVIFSQGGRFSLLFMALMVYIMVVVLSIFEGFQKQVQDSLWNSGYHITVTRKSSRKPITNHEALTEAIRQRDKKFKALRSTFGGISANALLERGGRFEGKFVRAVPVTQEELAGGRLKDYPELVHYDADLLKKFSSGNYILVGREMARYYGWELGDRITLYMPRGGVISRNLQIEKQRFRIAGFFRTGYYEFDQNLLMLSLKTAQKFLGVGQGVTEIVVQLDNLALLGQLRDAIKEILPGGPGDYEVITIKDRRGNFLKALQLEKILMVIIMGLLILAGAAGIWVTVHLLIKSKERSIGMLRAMGMPIWSIITIFTTYSMLIGFLATSIGASIGIYVANRLEPITHLSEDFINSTCKVLSDSCRPVELIPRNIYYFDHLPVHTDVSIIFGIAFATLVLSGLAGYFPSRKAARVDPVKALRAAG